MVKIAICAQPGMDVLCYNSHNDSRGENPWVIMRILPTSRADAGSWDQHLNGHLVGAFASREAAVLFATASGLELRKVRDYRYPTSRDCLVTRVGE